MEVTRPKTPRAVGGIKVPCLETKWCYDDTMIETTPMFYTYIVRCKDGTYYTGWTNDLEQRIAAHNQGKGAKYTRKRGPVELLATWISPSKSEAMKLEYSIKQMSRHEKQILIMQHITGARKAGNG